MVTITTMMDPSATSAIRTRQNRRPWFDPHSITRVVAFVGQQAPMRREKSMRVMVIVKATSDSEAGLMPRRN